MDLNYLLHRHQVSLMRADDADCSEARHVHRDLAAGYAERIAAVRHVLGAKAPLVIAP